MQDIVLVSGGLDSAVLLAQLCNDGEKPVAMTFQYGQLNQKELDSAKQLATHYGVEHITLEILNVHGKPINDSFYVPFRNTMFLSHACNYAEANNYRNIYYACSSNDYENYPDCRDSYVYYMNQILAEHGKIRIKTPFLSYFKKDIIRLGYKLKVPIDKTWSCYRSGTEPCMNCPACKLRSEAMVQ